MRSKTHIAAGASVVLALLIFATSTAGAQGEADVDAINRLIDRYGELEDAMDMETQATLMSGDRVWVTQGGRRTNQAQNMRIQQAAFDALRAAVPGIRSFTEDRDRLIKFYGNGTVAVASFYRYTTMLLPPDAPLGAAAPAAVPPSAGTLVLEKQSGEWKIVHTHFSGLGPANN